MKTTNWMSLIYRSRCRMIILHLDFNASKKSTIGDRLHLQLVCPYRIKVFSESLTTTSRGCIYWYHERLMSERFWFHSLCAV